MIPPSLSYLSPNWSTNQLPRLPSHRRCRPLMCVTASNLHFSRGIGVSSKLFGFLWVLFYIILLSLLHACSPYRVNNCVQGNATCWFLFSRYWGLYKFVVISLYSLCLLLNIIILYVITISIWSEISLLLLFPSTFTSLCTLLLLFLCTSGS